MTHSASQAFRPAHAFEVHISAARFAPYLDQADGDPDLAFELYQWNGRLTGAVHEVLGFVEVALRNALDVRLRTWNAAQPPAPKHGVREYTHDWLEVPAAPLYGLLTTVRHGRRHSTHSRATKRAAESRDAREPRHPRFGRPVTHDDLVANLMFRNRVAHHEPLIDLDVQAYHRTMVRLLRAIDPVLGDWFSGASPVPGVLRSRPV
ncbi:hypothetical protein C8K30_10755 [Promicromonospora sp. AC04]|nr:hypothetical protein C8K30_10755 [Promicromonospora sp. AC04]